MFRIKICSIAVVRLFSITNLHILLTKDKGNWYHLQNPKVVSEMVMSVTFENP